MLILMYFLIQILLVVLKIKNVIDWSWNKVLIPTWIMLGILAMGLVFCLGILIVSAAMCF